MLLMLTGVGLWPARYDSDGFTILALVIHAWHPLMLWEFAGSGDVDAAVGAKGA